MSQLSADVQQVLTTLCTRRQVARLVAIDGLDPSMAVLRLVVEFLPRAGFGAYLMARVEQELSDVLGRPVDLCAVNQLSPTEHGDCMASSHPVYAAKSIGS